MKKVLFLSLALVATVSFAFKAITTEKVTLIITHEVKDYAAWKKGFDSDEKRRSEAGFKILNVYRAVDNANVVTAIAEAPSVEAAKGFINDPNLKAGMEKAGVISAPDIKILNKVQ